MKSFTKAAALLLAVVTALCLLVSCGGTDEPSSEVSAVSATEESSNPEESAVSSEPVSEPASEPVSEPEIPDEFLHIAESVTDASEDISLSFGGGMLHISFVTPEINAFAMETVHYSLADGKATGRTKTESGVWNSGAFESGDFWVTDLMTGIMHIYGADGAEKKSVALSSKRLGNSHLTPDGSVAVIDEFDSELMAVVNIATGESVNLPEDTCIYNYYGFADGYMYFGSRDNTMLALNTADNSLSTLYSDECRYAVGLIGICTEEDYITFSPVTDLKNIMMFKKQSDNEWFMAAGKDCLLSVSTTENDNTARVYDLKCGVISEPFEFPGMVTDAIITDDGKLFIASQDGYLAPFDLYYYDISNMKSENALEILPLDDAVIYGDLIAQEPVSPEFDALAKKLLEKYRVRVVVENGTTRFSDYYETAIPDSSYLLDKLKVTEKFLDALPEGMTLEMGEGRETWINFCGTISKDGHPGAAGGFATTEHNHLVTVIDIQSSDSYYLSTIAHEFAHLFDNHISYTWHEGWVNMIPEDIRKVIYVGRDSSVGNEYTPYRFDDSEVWVYSLYARTNEKEDRAVTFEAMVMSYFDDKLGENFYYKDKHGNTVYYEHLLYKAEYYCDMLRASFRCLKDADNIIWEKFFVPAE